AVRSHFALIESHVRLIAPESETVGIVTVTASG
ncbi:MAG: hypothetical protein QOG89_690, partial [Thermomicrobiales bacterium]|nr:hypothetical protein [Thermomicrobiales bacterium]